MFLTVTKILARCLAHAATRAGGGEVGGALGEGLRRKKIFCRRVNPTCLRGPCLPGAPLYIIGNQLVVYFLVANAVGLACP